MNRWVVSGSAVALLTLVLVCSLTASADEEAPVVVGPADHPGADVVWLVDEEYELNATGSEDNVGIVTYRWHIVHPDGASTSDLTSATPTAKWTPDEAGIYKVISWAEDAAGNAGFHVFTVDVAEVIPASVIGRSDITYEHSVAVNKGTVRYQGTSIRVAGGRAAESGGGGAPEMLGDSLAPSLGSLSGHWEPYEYENYWRYGDSYYGKPFLDQADTFAGSASIRIDESRSYYRGFEYHFDSPADLTGYDLLTFWFKSGYYSYPSYIYIYIYSDYAYSGDYARVYLPGTGYYSSYY